MTEHTPHPTTPAPYAMAVDTLAASPYATPRATAYATPYGTTYPGPAPEFDAPTDPHPAAVRQGLVEAERQAQADLEQLRDAVDVGEVIANIPAKAWFAIRRRFDATLDEVLEDGVALMVIAAARTNLKREGSLDWDRFEGMTLTELSAFLGLDTDDTPEVLEQATKSDG